jgi:hypothetical protein
MKIAKWCVSAARKSNGDADLPPGPGAAFIILGHGEQRFGRLAVGYGMSEAPAASGLFETLLAVDRLGVCGGWHHGDAQTGSTPAGS